MPTPLPTIEFWFLAAAAFLFGLLFGSFLNVCIYRLPRGLSVMHPRSACPKCNAPIAAIDNVPIVSWFLLGGKCRHCQAAISKRYWVVELLTGVLFLASFLKFGPTLETFKLCAFSFLVLGLIFTDADLKLLPDDLTLTGLGLGLAFSVFTWVDGLAGLFLGDVAVLFSPTNATRFLSFVNSAFAAAAAALFIWGMGEIWFRLRGIDAMGFGDVKLMAMVAAFLGIKLTMLTILLGSFTGSVFGFAMMQRRLGVRQRQLRALVRAKGLMLNENKLRARARRSAGRIMRFYEIPFGVFLGVGALFAAFFGGPLVTWYAGFFR